MQEWHSRRWTESEIEALMECKVLPTHSERLRAFRHGGDVSDLRRFAEESGRSYQAVKAKWHYERTRRRGKYHVGEASAHAV